MSQEEFKRIVNAVSVKKVWHILKVIHEGTQEVKNFKLQILTIRFEELRMKEDETFNEFHVQLNDVVNSSFNLGEIHNNKVVSKILRSVP